MQKTTPTQPLSPIATRPLSPGALKTSSFPTLPVFRGEGYGVIILEPFKARRRHTTTASLTPHQSPASPCLAVDRTVSQANCRKRRSVAGSREDSPYTNKHCAPCGTQRQALSGLVSVGIRGHVTAQIQAAIGYHEITD